MINKKFKFLLFLSLFFAISSVFAADCHFTSSDVNCSRFSSSFVTFNLDISDVSKFSGNITAIIYNKKFPANNIPVVVENGGTVVRNVMPFVESGVYVLEIRAYNKGQYETVKSFEYIFDNLEPLPPLVPFNLYSTSNSLSFQLPVQSGYKIVTKVGTGSEQVFNPNLLTGNTTISLSLSSGLNVVSFYSQNSLGMRSKPIQRIVFGGGLPAGDENVLVSLISIDGSLQSYNGNTVYDSTSGKYITSKRNFYIQGSSQANSVVYINGIKTRVASSGKFGNFVILNEGENKIYVKNSQGNVNSSINVEYLNFRFQFLTLNIPKIITSPTMNIQGTTNLDLPFSVYLNGNYKGEFSSNNGNFNVPISGFRDGKNYLYIEGLNNQKAFELVYLDTQLPTVEIISSNNFANNKKFIFKLNDDIGINESSLRVNIGSTTYLREEIINRGDFYIIDLGSLSGASLSYSISFKDRAGKSGSKSGNILINSDNTLIDNIAFEDNDAYILGNRMFVKRGAQTLNLVPSRFIAFKKIYLDGVEQIDYDISLDGQVNLNLDFREKEGLLEFEFINNDYQEFSQNYTYYSDSETPKLKLDYINNPATNNFIGSVFISGEIIDNHFDWETLEINSDHSFNRYGNYFEDYVDLGSSGLANLNINGRDYSNNVLSKIFGSVLYKDGSISNIDNDLPVNQNYLESNFVSPLDINTKKLVESWDGIYSRGSFLENSQFYLPIYERSGLRAFKIKGHESSGNLFSDDSIYSIDSEKPKIYFVLDGSSYKILIDGTLSEVLTYNLTNGTGGSLLSVSNCPDLVSRYSKCFLINTDVSNLVNIDVTARDSAGNFKHETFGLNDYQNITDVIKSATNKPDVFISGVDAISSTQEDFIQGQFYTSSRVVSVKNNRGDDCLFDDFNFVCPITIYSGPNTFRVNVTQFVRSGSSQDNSSDESDNVTVTGEIGDIDLNINSVTGDGLFTSHGTYNLVFSPVSLNAFVDRDALISVLVDGNEKFNNQQNGTFVIELDLEDDISQVVGEKQIDVSLRAEDEAGNLGISNVITLIYNSVLETIVSVIVG